MSEYPTRRTFLAQSAVAGAAVVTAGTGPTIFAMQNEPKSSGMHAGTIYKTLKWGMIKLDGSTLEKFQLVKACGFDGVELDSPDGVNKAEALAASKETGLPIDGLVDSRHWKVRMTDPKPEVREQSLQDLLTALREAHSVDAHSVLLVPGHGNDGTKEATWERSIEQIRKALPTASKLGISILIENVWNAMFYQHDGPEGQNADDLVAYIDEINSPFVGVQFDIGNHQKYSKPADWIRALGRRIYKLDVKDWGKKNGWARITEGDVDWPDVQKALKEIGYTGWAAAEVGGGGEEHLKGVARRMDIALGL